MASESQHSRPHHFMKRRPPPATYRERQAEHWPAVIGPFT
jgi:hypothetical protein